MNTIYSIYCRLVVVLLALCYSSSYAQVIELGTGSIYTGSNFAGPAYTSTVSGAASRYAYIFPQSTVSAIMHGDSIISLDFYRNGGDSLSGTCNMKIYMRLGPSSDFGTRNINWVNQTGATGMKKVYDKNPAVEFGKVNGWVRVHFTTAYVADTTFGKNLEILIEYTQSASQSSNIYWSYESRFTVNGYGANQCKYTRTNGGTLQDTTNSSSEVHPSIKINFPRYNQDASIKMVYALGKIPIPLGNPDTVRALVKNIGKQSFSNQKIYIISKGKNQLIDSTYITLNYLEERLIRLPIITPTNLGFDTIQVKIAYDPNTQDNQAETYRIATENIYSYKDPTLPLAGGIGFNGSTGDFVAKFYSNTSKSINQINVSFSGISQKFRLGIWKADGVGGSPRTNIWTSDTLTSIPNFTTPVLPPVSVNGPFFVGVRQITTNNVAFGYQSEDPVRDKTFYYAAPYGDTNWIDFAPDAPYKFVIEPRLQADNDVSPLHVDSPGDTVNLITVKTMAPKATIINYGVNNQLVPFNVTMEIRRYGSLVYTSTKSDTLSSQRQHRITFDSTFLPTQAGNYDIIVYTRLASDQLKDNDTLRKKLIVAMYNDVGIGSLFDPDPYVDYEQYIDTVFPIANIQNFGLDNIGLFSVTSQILDSSNNVLYLDTKSTSLTAETSNLLVFKPYPCSTKGRLKFRIFTRLLNDSRKKNDTLVVFFNVKRSNDVMVSKSTYPQANKAIPPPAVQKFVNIEIENLGDLDQADPFPVYCKIYFNNNVVFYDSNMVTAHTGLTSNVFFSKFAPSTIGYYRMVCYAGLYNDQVRSNDTLKFNFSYGLPDDVEPFNPLPVFGSKLELGKIYGPKVSVRNNGINPQNNPFSITFKVFKGATIIYGDTKNLTLDSGASDNVSFDSSLSLNDTGQYQVLIHTNLNADFSKANDTLTGFYTGVKTYDVGVASIVFPNLTDTLMINTPEVYPVVILENFGDSLYKNRFITRLDIRNSNSLALLYSKQVDTLFTSDLPLSVTFPKIGNIGIPQPVTITTFTDYTNDPYRKNDTAYSSSQFENWYDLISQSISLPIDSGTYKTNAPFLKPVVSVKNGGKKRISNSDLKFVVKYVDTVNSIENQVYEDSIGILDLNGNQTSTIAFPANFDFSIQKSGLYKCYLSAFNQQDLDPGNNLLQSWFRILDASGISLIEYKGIAIYPNPASHFIMVNFREPVAAPVTVRIFDNNGKLVIENQHLENSNQIDIGMLSSGVYYVEVNNKRIKLLVQH